MFPEGKLQLGEIRENFANEIRIAGICDVAISIAARTQYIPGDRRNKEKLVFAELCDKPLQQFHGVVEGALRRHHQVAFDVVPVILWNTF